MSVITTDHPEHHLIERGSTIDAALARALDALMSKLHRDEMGSGGGSGGGGIGAPNSRATPSSTPSTS
ncbi:MAG: hypothetical protein R3B46_05390 [Phycisphaerales bacterium]